MLLVSNLPDSVANVNSIFNLLGVYGDVLCVKILHNKRDCALVQMAKPHQAQQVPSKSEKKQKFLCCIIEENMNLVLTHSGFGFVVVETLTYILLIRIRTIQTQRIKLENYYLK